MTGSNLVKFISSKMKSWLHHCRWTSSKTIRFVYSSYRLKERRKFAWNMHRPLND